MEAEPDLTDLSDRWTDVRQSAEGVNLEAELAREVPAEHVLAGVPVKAVAARKLRKEIVYSLPDGRWAWVHLTWAPETDPGWPRTVLTESWAALVDELRDGDRG